MATFLRVRIIMYISCLCRIRYTETAAFLWTLQNEMSLDGIASLKILYDVKAKLLGEISVQDQFYNNGWMRLAIQVI